MKSLLLGFLLTGCSTFGGIGIDWTLDLVYPQYGQRGTTVEVVAEGSYLGDAKELLFYQPGIRCLNVRALSEVQKHAGNGTQKLKAPKSALLLTLEISDDARLGEYQFRIRTQDRLTELVTFWVTPFPIVNERKPFAARQPNDTRDGARVVDLGSTVLGYLPESKVQDHDWYKVNLGKGERLTVETVASRLGTHHFGGMNDLAVAVYGPDGERVAGNDDNTLAGQDPYVTFRAPAAGTYLIDLRQNMDVPMGLRHYAMHVGSYYRPVLTYPLGVEIGKTSKLQLLGDVGDQSEITISDPQPTGEFEGEYMDVYTDGAVLPNRIHLAPFPNLLEKEGGSSKEKPQELGILRPVALNGVIREPGQIDWYRFRVESKDRFRVRTYAATLGSQLDAKILIIPAGEVKGARRYEHDDSQWPEHDLVGHHYRNQVQDRLDPIFMFKPNRARDYLLAVTDSRREGSAFHAYRIEFQPQVDSAFVHFASYPANPVAARDRINVSRGNTFTRPVSLQNGFGSAYQGALELVADLPDGVEMTHPPFTHRASKVPLTFSASDRAAVGSHLIDLYVRPVGGGRTFRGGFVQVNPATQRRGGYAMYFNRTRKMALAVVASDRFRLSVEPPKLSLVQNGELSLRINVERLKGYEGAIYLEADWLPDGVAKQPPIIIPEGQSSGLYTISAKGSATPGAFPFSITGREEKGGILRTAAGFHYASSPPVQVNVSEPFVTVKLNRIAIERGKVGVFTASLRHGKTLSEPAVVRLKRLPHGVRQLEPYPTISSSDRTVACKVEVTSDCLVGLYKDIFCEITVREADQEIRQQSGSGTLRVDPSRQTVSQ